MGGLTTAGGEHTVSGNHAGQVVRVGFAANQDDLLAFSGARDGLVIVEDDATYSRTRGGGHSLGQQLTLYIGGELREHQLG